MERNEIIEKIKTIVVSALEHNDFEMKDELVATEVSGWDSLTHIMLVVAIEKNFKIKFGSINICRGIIRRYYKLRFIRINFKKSFSIQKDFSVKFINKINRVF